MKIGISEIGMNMFYQLSDFPAPGMLEFNGLRFLHSAIEVSIAAIANPTLEQDSSSVSSEITNSVLAIQNIMKRKKLFLVYLLSHP